MNLVFILELGLRDIFTKNHGDLVNTLVKEYLLKEKEELLLLQEEEDLVT